ncbi:hypothetical protein F4703DRAFT_1823299 [Phycomyces blakesleeanus]
MATHDVHRAMEESIFSSFQHSLQNPTPLGQQSFRSMSASDLISIPPSTSLGHRHQPRGRPTSTASDSLHQHLMHSNSPEAEAIDRLFENLQRYEKMLEDVAVASLDQEFKDELQHINQWLRCRSDAERTAALYSVVQNASQIQIRFLITVLQQLAQDPLNTPAGQDKGLAINVASSVVSTESEYEMRRRQLYPPSRRPSRPSLCHRLSSALSEPDDLRRRHDFFPRTLGRPQELLYEKAVAARTQIQAHTSLSCAFPRHQPSLSTSTSASVSTSISTPESKSLFADWPFPLARKESSNVPTPIGHPVDDPWSFKKKKDLDLPWARTIKEDQAEEDLHKPAATIVIESNERLRSVSSSGSLLVPPPSLYEQNDDLSESDASLTSKDQSLTGTARRRKRSSAARALKDKLAAEAVDFELMKDVQNWLRSLRLHKYGHAFVGLEWQQVIRMTDADMLREGVNTIGARRKLLKVFENVQRHCDENVSPPKPYKLLFLSFPMCNTIFL